MLCIRSLQHDPFYNLAAEEYLLKNSGEEVFMLWQSDPVVVVGKHQNTLAEVNYRFIRGNNIQVARRMTGGGTVYHDGGNINFTFIRQGEPGRLVDFGSFIAPVIAFLKSLGIEAIRGQKNEILVDGKKISGNAEHVYRNRVLHHGTLLYNVNLDRLRESLIPGGRYTDKSVQSNRSSVMNLSERFLPEMATGKFGDLFMQFIQENFQGIPFKPGLLEQQAIQKLAVEKYRSWDWVYGWSPDYSFEGGYSSGQHHIEINLAVHRGLIQHCTLQSDTIGQQSLNDTAGRLTGVPHDENSIMKKLSKENLSKIIRGKDLEDLVLSFF
jgi:lipoate---protein ligase